MARKQETVVVDGVPYEVREIPVKDALPIMMDLTEGGFSAQLAIMGLAVFVDGQPLGREGAEDMGLAAFMRLAGPVMRLNGLRDEEDEETEGNAITG